MKKCTHTTEESVRNIFRSRSRSRSIYSIYSKKPKTSFKTKLLPVISGCRGKVGVSTISL